MKSSLAAIIVMLMPVTMQAQTAGNDNVTLTNHANVTLAGIVDSILDNNPTLQIAATQGHIEVMQTRAGNSLEPTEIEYSPFFTRGMSGLASSELIVSQSFNLPWVYTAQSKLAHAQATVNASQLQADREELRVAAKNLCIEVIGLNHALCYIERRLQIADSLITLYEKGDATALEINQLKIERAAVANERSETVAAREKALLLLAEMNAGQPVNLQGIDYPTMQTPDEATLQSYQQSTIENQLSKVALARQQEKTARAQSLPSMTLGYRRNTEGSVSSHGVLIGVNIPVFTNKKQRSITRLQRQQAENQATVAALQVERERQTLQIELQLAHDRLQAIDISLVDSTLSLLRASLEHGQISLTEYLTRTAPLYTLLQEAVATRTVLHQTETALGRK